MKKELDPTIEKYFHTLAVFKTNFCDYDQWKLDMDFAEKVINRFCNEDEIDKKKLKKAVKLANGKDVAPYNVSSFTKLDKTECAELRFPGITENIKNKLAPIWEDLSKYRDYKFADRLGNYVYSRPKAEKWYIKYVATQMVEELFHQENYEFIARFLGCGASEMSFNNKMDEREYGLAGIAYKINHFANNHKNIPYVPISEERWSEIVREELKDLISSLSPEGASAKIKSIKPIFSGFIYYRTNTEHFFDLVKDFSEKDFYLQNEMVHDGTLFYTYASRISNGDEDYSVSNVYEKLLNYSFEFNSKK